MFRTSLGFYIIICAITWVITFINSLLDGEDIKGSFLIFGKISLILSTFYWGLVLGLYLIGLN